MTNSNIAEIVKGLSEAQRCWITCPENKDDFWCNDLRTWTAIERRGLIEEFIKNSTSPWTPLGLQVRKYIQENGDVTG